MPIVPVNTPTSVSATGEADRMRENDRSTPKKPAADIPAYNQCIQESRGRCAPSMRPPGKTLNKSVSDFFLLDSSRLKTSSLCSRVCSKRRSTSSSTPNTLRASGISASTRTQYRRSRIELDDSRGDDLSFPARPLFLVRRRFGSSTPRTDCHTESDSGDWTGCSSWRGTGESSTTSYPASSSTSGSGTVTTNLQPGQRARLPAIRSGAVTRFAHSGQAKEIGIRKVRPNVKCGSVGTG